MCHLHDPAAILAVSDPDLFTYSEIPLEVACDLGDEFGRTRQYTGQERKRPDVKVAMGVDASEAKKRFLSMMLLMADQ